MTPKELDNWRAALAPRLGEGYDVANLVLLETACEVIADSSEEVVAIAEAALGGPAPVNKRGKPTTLKVVKWMCHAGYPNANGAMFVEDELKGIANTLFQEPDFGVMDWNHGAIFPFDDTEPNIGVWYKAEWELDPKARNGEGAWGIRVHGVMFAWLFPEIADSLLAEQARSGSVKGSMACFPQSVEFPLQGDGVILHNPVFMTHSLLSRTPADADATGLVSENPEVTHEQLREQLLATRQNAAAISQRFKQLLAASRQAEDNTMNQELETVKAQVVELEALNAELTTQLATSEARFAELVEKLEVTHACDVCGAVTCPCTTVAELETAKDALTTKVTELETQLAEAATKLAETAAKLAEFEAAAAEQAKTVRLQARLAELPEAYRTAHAKRSVELRQRLESAWAEMSDEDWALKKEELSSGLMETARVGFVALSQKESPLPSVNLTEEADDLASRLSKFIR